MAFFQHKSFVYVLKLTLIPWCTYLFTSVKNHAFFTWKISYYAIWYKSLILRSLYSKWLPFTNVSRLVFSRFLDLRGNFGIVKGKPTRKTCFSRGKKGPAPRIYQAKFRQVTFLWSQRNLYYIFTRNRC